MASFALLTEDSGKGQATRVVESVTSLFLRVLRLPDGKFIVPDDRVRALMRGNRWKGEPTRRHLLWFMAAQLRQGDHVVFHIDADVTWGQEHKNVSALEAVRADLAKLLTPTLTGAPARKGRRDRQATKPPPIKPEPAPGSLLCMLPYYSIESWLYLSVEGTQEGEQALAALV
jgi:hypothetical protein